MSCAWKRPMLGSPVIGEVAKSVDLAGDFPQSGARAK